MLRKLARSIARTSMEANGIHIFGKYALSTMPVRNKHTGKTSEQDVIRSFFAREWRNYL